MFMPDLDEDYNSEETEELIATSHENLIKDLLAASPKSVTDPMPYYQDDHFLPAYCYPTSIVILDAEIGFNRVTKERILVPPHA